MKKLYLITLLSLMLCVSCTKKAETDPKSSPCADW